MAKPLKNLTPAERRKINQVWMRMLKDHSAIRTIFQRHLEYTLHNDRQISELAYGLDKMKAAQKHFMEALDPNNVR
jgi:hypothetical protein